MIKFHEFNVGQAGSGTIDLIRGHTYFMLGVIPSTDSLLVDVSLKYDSDYQTAKIPNTVPNTFNGGFDLDINGGDPNPSVVTSGNVTTITGTNGKTIKFTFATSGSDKRLIKIEDFDNKVTDFIYVNNLLREVVQGTDKITLDYDGTRLKEVVDITKVGVEILRSGDNFTLRDITDNATPRQTKDTITIARTMSGENANRAIITDAQTGVVLDKTFDLDSTREFCRENLLIGGVQKQVTIECHSMGFNTDTYIIFCKQDKFNRIPQASDFPATAAMSDSDLANLLNPNSFLNQTGGYWVITRFNAAKNIMSQHFCPQKAKDAAGQTITRDVAKTFIHSGNNLTSESTIITENGVTRPPLVTNYTYTGAKVDEVTAPNGMKTKFIYNKQPQPAPSTITKMTRLGTHQTGWNSPYYISTSGGFYFTIQIGSTFIHPNGTHNTTTPPTETTYGIPSGYWSTGGKRIYYNISIGGRMFSMLEVTVTNSNGNIDIQLVDFSNNDDTSPPENTIIYISWFAPSLVKQRPNCDAKVTHIKAWHPSSSSEVMIVEMPDDEADDTTGDLNYVTPEWKKGLLEKLASGTSQVDYEYDLWGRRSLVKLGQQNTDTVPHVAYQYYDSMNNAYAFYAGGTVFAMHHDNFGKVVSIERMTTTTISEPIPLVNYQYDSEGRLTEVFDYNDGPQITSYQYGAFGEVTQIQQGDVTITPFVDADGNIERTTYKIQNRPEQVYKYELGENNGASTQTTKLAGDAIETADFDVFGRLRQIQTPIGITDFVYKREPIENNQYKVSSEIESITDISGTTKYEYYEDGNIKKIKVNNADVAEYDYDDYGRLWHENDIEYEYDTNGNTKTKGANIYGYNDPSNPNRLTSFNGEVIAYDYINNPKVHRGNPTTYRNKPMQWDFKNLRSYKETEFAYDASGLRQTKTHGNVVTKFHWTGDKLIAEKRTTVHNNILGKHIRRELQGQPSLYLLENHLFIDYIYGATEIVGFTLQRDQTAKETYWYTKNVQGDVTHIYQQKGSTNTLVAEYAYDAWGNHTVVNHKYEKVVYIPNNGMYLSEEGFYPGQEISEEVGIGDINPIRYRGYYFDTETGLYYTLTRYYDPETGRFISPDDIGVLDVTKDMVNGLNLYAYCGNDPVNYMDSAGRYPEPAIRSSYYYFRKPDFWSSAIISAEFIGAASLLFLGGVATNSGSASGMAMLNSFAPKFATGMKWLGYGAVALSTIGNIVGNINNGVGVQRIITDAMVDIGVGVGSIWLTSAISGAIAGSLIPIPIVGTAIGAIVGVGIGLGVYYLTPVVNDVKVWIDYAVTDIGNWIGSTANNIAKFLKAPRILGIRLW